MRTRGLLPGISTLGVPTNSLLRGNIDLFQPAGPGEAHLVGWLFREDQPLDAVDVSFTDNRWLSRVKLQPRPDVRAAFSPTIGACPHLAICGFDVTAPLPEGITARPDVLLHITPFSASGLPFDPLLSYYCAYHDELIDTAQPPASLQERVGGSKDFLQVGVQAASLVMTCVAKYKPDFQSSTILDWGCGCGRVINQLRKFIPAHHLFGCDIDMEAIEWNSRNISGANFVTVLPYPPTPYAAGSFDIIYGISVMTHLDEKTQMRWLEELKRITRRGAILALSVMGEKLRKLNMPVALEEQFKEQGFAAFVPNYSDMLSGFSHPGYYKEAYHTVDYVAKCWGRYFEVLEYVETGHQDIVMLRAS